MSSSLVLSGVGLTDPTTSPFLSTAKILIKGDEITGKKRNGFCLEQQQEDEAGESSESSSIGADSSSTSSEKDREGGDGEEEVQSSIKHGAFSSLESIEESLPIKRGLSNFFSGKSKSFASLSEMASGTAASDLAKSENPFNKRRRILMASKMRRASYSSLVSTYLPPLLSPDNAVLEEGDEEEEEKGIESSAAATAAAALSINNRKSEGLKTAFRSPRSFSLSDLQHA